MQLDILGILTRVVVDRIMELVSESSMETKPVAVSFLGWLTLTKTGQKGRSMDSAEAAL